MLIDLYGDPLTSAPVAAPPARAPAVGFTADRALARRPDPRWAAELARITEPSTRVSSLLIRWHPGTERKATKFRTRRWMAVERWIVYQKVPIRATPMVLFAPYGQTFGRRVRVRTRGVDLLRPLVDRVQWELYLETGCYCQPYWVLQGPNGGHRRNYDRQEEQLAQLVGLPTAPPDLGALPYVEPSSVTWRKLNELDELRRYKLALAFDQRPAEQLEADEREARIEMRLAILKHMDEKAYEAVSGHMHEWRDALASHELPARVERHSMRAVDDEAAERRFVYDDL